MKCYRVIYGMVILVLLLSGCGKTNDKSISETNNSKKESTSETNTDNGEDGSMLVEYTGTYRIISEVYDWGPVVATTIVSLDDAISEAELEGLLIMEDTGHGEATQRTISEIYLSDGDGNKIDDESTYFTAVMDVTECYANSLLTFDVTKMVNKWNDNYKLLFSGSSIKLTIDEKSTSNIIPEVEVFETYEFTYNDITLHYASYVPESDKESKPLIIWLHGQGEGGTDTTVTLTGNKVTALAGSDIQKTMNGAYVLVPQCPYFWPETHAGYGNYGTSPSKDCLYTETLYKLIAEYTSTYSDIDINRIYIGGCSMGGYMTMKMLTTYPDMFAAAYLISEFYPSSIFTEEDAKALKDVPMWFVFCTEDFTVKPEEFSIPTIEMLKAAGAADIRFTSYNNITDILGKYSYYAHWAWVPVFNNVCEDRSINIWEWLAQQTLTDSFNF